MRFALLLPVLFSLAAPAYAEGARESRYGPTTPRQASAATAARYDGPMLGWANKRQAMTNVAAPAPSAPAQPAPLAAWAGYRAAPAPVAYAPPAPTAPTLPTNLYAAPRPSPAAAATPDQSQAPAKDWSSYRSARMTAVAPVAPTAPQVAAVDTGATGARFYSVGRDYGLTPDAAPPAGVDNRVFVTVSEPPPEPKDAVPMHGSADWLAAGARGDDGDDDDSATRRAKTRNEGL
ncbi:hypothetical protein ASD21_08590 [Caulobacter sp. Root1455]|uniref:hypothetical protein n=1 Tax=Caulobacter sp. Root1455 TaxID=1736465 RepID=UPI0006F4FB44|nr:hypothetical protein [Caulobacter sp. Root1455]KQY95393.1 hypothetical protein ASD21_08590 [Caulobacter sp. Root1455]